MPEEGVGNSFDFLYRLCNPFSTYVLYSLVEIRREGPLHLNPLDAPCSADDTRLLYPLKQKRNQRRNSNRIERM